MLGNILSVDNSIWNYCIGWRSESFSIWLSPALVSELFPRELCLRLAVFMPGYTTFRFTNFLTNVTNEGTSRQDLKKNYKKLVRKIISF